MSRIDQHAVFGFWIFVPFYILMTGTLSMDRIAMFHVLLFSIFPDLDSIYYFFKAKGRLQLDNTFQHHYKSITHYPLFYTPLIVLIKASVIINFYPVYFLAPVIGIYGGHFLFDSIACGDGIMWGKNPLKRRQYGRFINIYCQKTDGYHGKYWYARYRQTWINRIGNILVLGTILMFFLTRSNFASYNYSFSIHSLIGQTIFTIIFIMIIRDIYSKKWKLEPPNGRYSDYRKDNSYINGLSEKNRSIHLEKFSFLFE